MATVNKDVLKREIKQQKQEIKDAKEKDEFMLLVLLENRLDQLQRRLARIS